MKPAAFRITLSSIKSNRAWSAPRGHGGIKRKDSSGVLCPKERAGQTGDLQLGGIFHRDRREEKRGKRRGRNRYMIKKTPVVFDSCCRGAMCITCASRRLLVRLYAADRRVLGDFDV